MEGTHIPHITQIGRTLLLGLIASALGSAQTLSDGFDYPVGNSVVTAANDGDGYYLFQGFGTGGHLGEDWNGEGGGNSDWGDPVYAVSNGTIVYAQNAGPGWGNIVIIEHLLPDGSRILSFYAHLDEILRSQGDVSKGQQIGTIGRGYHYGGDVYDYIAHLHFEIRTDPTNLSPGSGYSPDSTGWASPSTFIEGNRTLQPALTGTVTTQATLNGAPWSGPIEYNIVGPQGVLIGQAVPASTPNLPPGQYTMLYKQGGPATFKGFVVFDDSFEGVAPSTSQTLDPGATITFTLQFLFTHILQCTFNANAQDCIIACQDRGVEAVERCVLLEPSSPERAECFRKFIMEMGYLVDSSSHYILGVGVPALVASTIVL